MSFSEIFLIMGISLVLFGPKQLPLIAQKFGMIYAQLHGLLSSAKSELINSGGIDELNQLKQEVTSTFNEIKHQLVPSLNHTIQTQVFNSYHEYEYLYQPELDFDRQPELFD